MVAAFQLMRKGNDPVQPRDDLDYSANFLYMLSEQEPDPLAAKIFDICLTLHAEHTINASTFSAMVTASTLTDPYAVVASAVGTLAGPLHGGANEEVIEMLEEIGSVENVESYLDRCFRAKNLRLWGFWAPSLQKLKDPRATILQELAQQLFDKFWGAIIITILRSPSKPLWLSAWVIKAFILTLISTLAWFIAN